MKHHFVEPAEPFTALFFSIIVACILFGVTLLQLYIYFRTYPEDRRIHQLSVATLVVLDATTLALSVAGFWNMDSFSHKDAPAFRIQAFRSQIAITGVLFSLQQSLYWYRIWCVRNGARLLPICIALIVCAGWVFNIAFGVILFNIAPTKQRQLISLLTTWTWVTPFNDIVIAAALCYYLRRARYTNPGWIDFLTRWLLCSGLLTSAFSIGMPVVLASHKKFRIFIALDAIIPRLYVNSFLAMLNSRSRKEEQAVKADRFTEDLSA